MLTSFGSLHKTVNYKSSSLVNYYSVFRLNQLDEWMVYLYLLCFIYHRYQRLHDNLLNSLIYNVRRYIDDAKVAAKERVYQHRIEVNSDLQKAGQVLKLFTDDSIAEETPFHQVQAKAFGILLTSFAGQGKALDQKSSNAQN